MNSEYKKEWRRVVYKTKYVKLRAAPFCIITIRTLLTGCLLYGGIPVENFTELKAYDYASRGVSPDEVS